MATFNPGYDDTSTWGYGFGNQGPWTATTSSYRARYSPPPKPPTMAAWRRLRLAETRTRPRVTSDPLPPSETPQPLPRRRELQRAGPVGYARLGGRRPL